MIRLSINARSVRQANSRIRPVRRGVTNAPTASFNRNAARSVVACVQSGVSAGVLLRGVDDDGPVAGTVVKRLTSGMRSLSALIVRWDATRMFLRRRPARLVIPGCILPLRASHSAQSAPPENFRRTWPSQRAMPVHLANSRSNLHKHRVLAAQPVTIQASAPQFARSVLLASTRAQAMRPVAWCVPLVSTKSLRARLPVQSATAAS